MPNNIDHASKWASFFNSSLSIITVVGSAIVFCTVAYIMIFTNAKDIETLKKDLKDRDAVIEERASKRYQDGMGMAIDFKMQQNDLEERINELEKQIEYLKGQHAHSLEK